MRRPFGTALILAFLIAFLPLALFPAYARDPASIPLPGADLRARVEARLERERTTLRESIGHYALIYDVSQEELHHFMAQIFPRREGPDIVMAGLGGIELHGGAVLELVATLWRPNGRKAHLSDAFPFAWSQGAVALSEIYASLRMQVFLPVPGVDTEEIDGQLPTSPELPRTRMQHEINGKLDATELDAYNALGLFLDYESDVHATWTNRLGQRLSVATLLDSTWNHYILRRSAEEEFADHSYLHLVELLLAYNRGLDDRARRDPNLLKRRLLSVELERKDYGGYEASEALGHYVESLGTLLAEPGVTFTVAEMMTVRRWLRELETNWLTDIGEVPLEHLTHLRRGLARIEATTGP
jgi:hypothetical protein